MAKPATTGMKTSFLVLARVYLEYSSDPKVVDKFGLGSCLNHQPRDRNDFSSITRLAQSRFLLPED